ncbi:hypothetical protein LTR70_004924 [Exophiala xenobiotica]|uniref:Spindle pole body component n=1 Tax=Lithohypha guttulata TaxID=1690604 RepID=A0ABR0KBN8_9EURO|nr:hypothetical protein LTR24_004544 [Lithohypha guttulata]KAK5319740.1 hypothetical protein LTR70_004924 [Exophiala xenobiotica]
MSSEIAMDPFSSKNLLRIGDLHVVEDDIWLGFNLNSNLRSVSLQLAKADDIAIPPIESDILRLRLEDTPLERIGATYSASDPEAANSGRGSDETNEDVLDEDIWNNPIALESTTRHELLSWDSFEGYNEERHASKYLSEAAPEVYDAIWDRLWQSEHGQNLKFARTDHFHHALTNLLIGRNSSLFRWNQETATFELPVEGFSFTNYSPAFTQTLLTRLRECGSCFRNIKDFCGVTKGTNPTLFAFQGSAKQILHAIERHSFEQHAALRLPTILELVDSANRYVELLRTLRNLVGIAASSENEMDCLTQCIELIDAAWLSSVRLRPVLSTLASQILTPTLRITSQQLGLCTRQADWRLSSEWALSKLMPTYHGVFTETIECLTIIREHSPWVISHHNRNTPVKMIQKWHELIDLQCEADDLECTSRSGLSLTEDRTHTATTTMSPSQADVDIPDLNPFKLDLALPMVQSSSLLVRTQPNSINDLISTSLSSGHVNHADQIAEISPSRALDLSLSPFLAVQHRISSYALMRMLFLQHDVVAHLDLLHSYHLLGNGSFAIRLSRALFDADENSAEGRRKTGLTAGLRVEDRDVWPPASSELRLVLMGLLAVSSSHGIQKNVLECISFAIRDLTDEELELCRDVHSIHALDFLRLVYAPSNALLELIITSSVLDKYDRIFRFLLVLLRMHALSQNLVIGVIRHPSATRQSVEYHRFCTEIHHLVTSLLDFALREAIGTPWLRFTKHLGRVATCLREGRYEDTIRLAGSVAQIRQMLEECVDEMLRTLLLKKKQSKVYDGLCRLLTLGLELTSHTPVELSSKQNTTSTKNFRVLLASWLSQLRDVSKNARDPALQRLEILILKVDMFDYYEQGII